MSEVHWTDTNEEPNRKARRQLEFLIYNMVPLAACIGFAVYVELIQILNEIIMQEYQ